MNDYQIRLFTGEAATVKDEPADGERSRSREPPARDNSALGRKSDPNAEGTEDAIDLCSVLPENFTELARITQIK